VFGVIIYSSVTINGLRTIVVPTEEDTEMDRTEALRVLSAGNTLIVLCLVGVLFLQVRPDCLPSCSRRLINSLAQGGQEYARRLQVKLEAKEKAKAVPVEEKKTQ